MSQVLFPGAVGDVAPRELEITLEGVTLRGTSVAARATAFAVPELGVALDLGRLSPTIAAQPVVLVSHTHLDHFSAVLAYLNLRARFWPAEPPRLLVPAEVAEPLKAALRLFPGVESVRKRMDVDAAIVGVEEGVQVPLPGGWAEPFAADHGRPSLGWRLYRGGGNRPALVFAGDGTTEPFVARPELLDGAAAVVECTYLEENRRIVARLARHAHLKDWVELAPYLTCDTLVLAHLPELGREELERAARPLAQVFRGRIVLWASKD